MRTRSPSRALLRLVPAMLLALAGTTAEAQTSATPTSVPSLPGGAEISEEPVPFPVRAESLISGLAQLSLRDSQDGSDRAGALLRGVGLDPDTAAARELLALALALEDLHPMIPADMGRGRGIATKRMPSEADGRDRWVIERYRLVGNGLGSWLRSRSEEGFAVETLLDRLLNGPHLAVSMFTNDPGELAATVAAQEEALQTAVRHELGFLPRRLDH